MTEEADRTLQLRLPEEQEPGRARYPDPPPVLTMSAVPYLEVRHVVNGNAILELPSLIAVDLDAYSIPDLQILSYEFGGTADFPSSLIPSSLFQSTCGTLSYVAAGSQEG